MAETPRRRYQAKEAVALGYKPQQDAAPKILGKGKGFVAEKILEIARKHGIPIKYEPDLVQILSKLDLNEQIPPSLYRVVAEIFAFVYRVNRDYPRRSGGD